jgi:hypothetical protein
MSPRKQKVAKRPAKKQRRGAVQKTLNVVAKRPAAATRSGSRKGSPRGHATSPLSKKRQPSRVIAEAHGLARRDAVVSAHPGAGSRVRAPEAMLESGIDQLWSTMVKLSPFSLALRQQAVIARMVLGVMIPSIRNSRVGCACPARAFCGNEM